MRGTKVAFSSFTTGHPSGDITGLQRLNYDLLPNNMRRRHGKLDVPRLVSALETAGVNELKYIQFQRVGSTDEPLNGFMNETDTAPPSAPPFADREQAVAERQYPYEPDIPLTDCGCFAASFLYFCWVGPSGSGWTSRPL